MGGFAEAAGVRDTILAQGSNGVSKMGIMKMMGLRKSTKLRQDGSELRHDQQRKLKVGSLLLILRYEFNWTRAKITLLYWVLELLVETFIYICYLLY